MEKFLVNSSLASEHGWSDSFKWPWLSRTGWHEQIKRHVLLGQFCHRPDAHRHRGLHRHEAVPSRAQQQHELKWHCNGVRMVSAPVSWKSSPVPLWQLAWSSSHSSTRFPLGVVGPAVGAKTRPKNGYLAPPNRIPRPLAVASANAFAENSHLWQGGQEHGLPPLQELHRLRFCRTIGEYFVWVFDLYLLKSIGCLSLFYSIYRNILLLRSSWILSGYLFMTPELRTLMREISLELFFLSFSRC